MLQEFRFTSSRAMYTLICVTGSRADSKTIYLYDKMGLLQPSGDFSCILPHLRRDVLNELCSYFDGRWCRGMRGAKTRQVARKSVRSGEPP
jgi:hypothetical protein